MSTVSGTEIPRMQVDDKDWSALTLGERIRHIELEGYLVIPDLLSPAQIAHYKKLTATLETKGTDYSERQRGRKNVQWDHPDFAALVVHPPTIAFLAELLGEDLVFLGAVYARSEPGHPGISLHTDGQPYGSAIFGYAGSCPIQVRALYYLDDLTADVSPFLVVPRSHLSMHAEANPYTRYACHPEQVAVPAKAGSAVFLNHRCFHGNLPNKGNRNREMLAYLYRPAWAGPIEPKIPAWDEEQVAALPAHIRKYFADPNLRKGFDFNHPNKPPNMRHEAPGIAPSRWERV
jgi:hypothetical protein